MRIQNVTFLGLSFFFAAINIGFSTTNLLSYSLVGVLRPVFLALAVVLVFSAFRGQKVSASFLISGLLLAFYYFWAVFVGFEVFSRGDIWIGLLTSILISLAGMLYVASANGDAPALFFARFFLVFVAVMFAINVAIGGIKLGFVPEYVFERTSESGSVLLYSQGVTKFYGFGAVLATWISLFASQRIHRYLLLTLSMMLLYLSFLGGGRGDFIASAFVVAAILFTNGMAMWVVLIVIPVFTFFFTVFDFSNVVAVSRFVAFFGADTVFGTRDELFGDALKLIIEHPSCVVWGCGFSFFQEYYGFASGLYPHNFVLEAVITWGLPGFSILIGLCVVGMYYSNDSRLYFWTFLFFFLISLKSGDVISSWVVTIFLFHYAGRGVCRFLSAVNRVQLSNWKATS